MKYFLYFLLKITQKETSLFYRTGTSVAGLDIENFMTKKQLTEPPEPILKKFNLIIKQFFDKISLNYKETTLLKEIKNNLLPRILSGKIKIPIEVKK